MCSVIDVCLFSVYLVLSFLFVVLCFFSCVIFSLYRVLFIVIRVEGADVIFIY